MCHNLGIYVLSLLLILASGGETRTGEKVKGLTKDGATEFALQKGVNDCGTDSNATLCGTSPVSWVMSEECEKNPVVKQSCSFSCSPSGQLQEAAWRGSLVGVEEALATGANPLCQKTFIDDHYDYYVDYGYYGHNLYYHNRTAIHLAASANQQWIIKKLLDAGVDVNLQTTEGITPTYDASLNGSTDALKILIEHNANVNLPNAYGLTPLMAAVRQRQLSVAKALINANASMDVTNTYGQTALYQAVIDGHQDMVLLLIKHNANVNLPDSKGTTPLMAEAWRGQLSVAKALINANASIDVTGGTRNATALFWAVWFGHQDIALLLIEHNANVSLEDYSGKTPLMKAAAWGHLSVAKALLKANASIDVTDTDGWTALYWTIIDNKQDMALLLLQSGADPMIPDAEGVTPAAAARHRGHNDLAAVIESYITTGAQGGITAA